VEKLKQNTINKLKFVLSFRAIIKFNNDSLTVLEQLIMRLGRDLKRRSNRLEYKFLCYAIVSSLKTRLHFLAIKNESH